MTRRHPPVCWPSRWLVTDERMGNRLLGAIRRLPRGSGILFRHYRLSPAERLTLGRRIASEARRRELVLAVAGDVSLARRLGAILVHKPDRHPGLMPFSLPVHNEMEALAARRQGAALVFVSPIFATRSHPGGRVLGPDEARRLACLSGATAIALGGMDEGRMAALGPAFHGYAGIDCWIRT